MFSTLTHLPTEYGVSMCVPIRNAALHRQNVFSFLVLCNIQDVCINVTQSLATINLNNAFLLYFTYIQGDSCGLVNAGNLLRFFHNKSNLNYGSVSVRYLEVTFLFIKRAKLKCTLSFSSSVRHDLCKFSFCENDWYNNDVT